MQYKSIKIASIKANVEQGVIDGYASYFSNKDSHGDIIQPGAFTKTIKENANRIKVLWQHDMQEPIGKPLTMEEDSKGLYTSSKISETDVGKKALILARDGVLNEMSIGFNTIKEDYNAAINANIIREIKLWEYSLVTFASNELAKVSDVKNLISEYQYSKGNILDILALKLFEQIKTLMSEPQKSTQAEEIINDDVQKIMAEIKKMMKG
jgi:hypothetical protein